MKRFLFIPLVGVILFTSSACRTPVSTVEREDPIGVPNVVNDRRVITDSRLDVQVVQVSESIVSGDLTRVQVQLRNTSSRARTINYQFEWYDLEGMVVQSNSTWKSHRLLGNQVVTLTATAPSPRAKDFRLHLMRSTQ